MSDYVSMALCDELYQATEWEGDGFWARSNYTGLWTTVPDKNFKLPEYHDEPGAGNFYDHKPAYSLAFVLDKTPKRDGDIRNTFMLGRSTDNKRWSAVRQDIVEIDPVPQDAIARLLIKSIRQGKLLP